MKQNERKNAPENGTQPELPNVIPGAKPFTKYKIAELCVCGAAVILGLIYLYLKWIPLGVLLPVYAVLFCAIVPLRWKDAKATGATEGFAVLSTVIWAVMALLVVAATAVYFIWY
ncbi:MAG: hypothetical protein IKZ41_08390 [Clostridia bacterium]|nr:hypothetical protein [Clostridia bacterium]MBR5366739.1 hypothetical protein [Clostridia bacterium]